jgi:hypothetical protein
VGNSLTDYLDTFEDQRKVVGVHFGPLAGQDVPQQRHVLLSHKVSPKPT